uniref:NADH-ubiquinone oxidoreductase chain 6 n=1 Tax=Zalieutes elater TaxID=412627 RepID=D3KRJ0_9TELE|nr:NADH dehydrogenase subunit 6 [Zalieutes elater]WMY89614.1 NADH dehydrogenase subunit 6 [Zalieutes elater]BAI77077.1 NADH dehydrogenase subunit 6 [Zalieutes elater]
MSYFMFLLFFGLVGGLVVVASNPSPYFAAFGLVIVAGVGCGVLMGAGAGFLSLVLFLIYLGGMLVVFAYSAALAAEPYPEGVGSRPVAFSALTYLCVIGLVASMFWGGWYTGFWLCMEELGEFSMSRGDVSGLSLMYSEGGGMLIIGAWVLLLALFVVLELTRGLSRGTLRVA